MGGSTTGSWFRSATTITEPRGIGACGSAACAAVCVRGGGGGDPDGGQVAAGPQDSADRRQQSCAVGGVGAAGAGDHQRGAVGDPGHVFGEDRRDLLRADKTGPALWRGECRAGPTRVGGTARSGAPRWRQC